MENMFLHYDWCAIRLENVFRVKTEEAGTRLHAYARTDVYQLGIKFYGRTDINYHNEPLPFYGGSVLYLPKEERHDIVYNKLIAEAGDGVCVFFGSERPLPPVPHIFSFEIGRADRLFMRLLEAYERDARSVEAMAAFYEILTFLAGQEAHARHASAIGQRLLPAARYLEEHCCDMYMDMSRPAALCKMTPGYFRHAFCRVYGMPPLQYAHKKKAERIKTLLQSHSYSLTEVAHMTGFAELNYFSRFFKKHFGTSASAYQKKEDSLL